MKDLSLSQNRLEHHYAKSSSTSLLTKKDSDHGYAKSSTNSSTKKTKKAEVMDPKQRKLSFTKVPSLHKVEVTYVSSDSDEPLSSIKSVEADSMETTSYKSSNHSVNGLKDKITSKSSVKDLPPRDVFVLPSNSPKDGDDKKIGLWPKPKKTPTLIQSPGFSRKNSIKKGVSMDGDKEGKKKKVANGRKLSFVKKESSSTKKKKTPDSGKKRKKGVIPLPSDSDSDLDVPLSKLKTSPKSDTKKCPVKPLKSKRSLSMSERSPKVKISHSKSPKMKDKKEFKQRTLFDFGKQMNKGSAFAQNRFGVSNEKELKSLEVMVKKIDWKGLSEAEREKVRQQKKEEWNRVRREKKRMLNQKFDDLELSNVSPLPQAKPINLQGGLSNAAFGDIAMIVEFIYSYSKFLAPEETPTITAELLIKALAAGSQGANVVSKVVLVFLRTLIGEEEREINGLGIGLADMPLTTFTVSELLYHYLKLTCEMPVKEKDDGNDDDDDDDDASSVSSVASGMASHEEMPKKIIDKLEKNEIYTLPASDQLKVLIFLFYKIIDSEYFLDYLENLKMEAKELWREQDAFRKKAAKERKEEQSKSVESKTQSPSDVLKIDQFAKKLEPGAKTNEQKQDGDLKPTKEALVVSKGADDLEANKGLQNEEVKREKTSEDPKVVGSGQKEIMDLDSKVNENMMKDYPKEPVADLVHIVRQRRVMAAKQAALKDEEERKDKERRNELDELRQKTKKVQAWKDGLDRCKRSLRLEPIGVDRHFKLYWVFSQGMPGIYVEDGYMYYDARENRTIDSWECYDTVQDIDKLLKALAKQGVRESALKACISNQYKHITNIITKKNQEHFELQPYDVFEESIKVLKEDLLESGNKIVKGALGVILNHEGWEKKVEEAKTLDEMTPLLLDLQQSVMPKFLEGAMSQSKGEQVVQNWRDNVKQVKTMSALHTLLGILENSVKWDKSAENAKCKICRRKGGDDYLILCDECNRAYHPYCLRPALIDFPVSNWKCPACAPSLPLSRSRTRRKEEQIDYDETGRDDDSGEDEEKEEEKEQGDDEDDSDHEDQCHVCGEDGELICCDQCPKVYHLDCHEPPIRRLPRGIWICFVCRNPKMATRLRRAQESYEKSARHRNRISREKKQSRGTRGKLSSERRRRGYRDEEGDESESSGSGSGVENDTEEEVEEKHRRGSRRGRKSRRRGGSSVEESGGEEETSRNGKQKSRRKMPQKRRSSNTGDESSEPSPKSKKRGRKEPVVDEEPTTRQSRRRSRPLSENDEEDDADEPVSKRPTRRRKLRESEENSGETQREDRGNSSSKRRNSEELSFGRRSRNRNRGQNSEIVACENILKGMWKCKSAYHFRNPVDLKKVPDYSRFVINPMDLSRIRDKLEMLEYEDAFQFVDDVKLVFENSKRYNEDTSDVGQEAKDLEKEFYRLLRQNLPGLHSSLSDDN